jgi:hypothetical protein
MSNSKYNVSFDVEDSDFEYTLLEVGEYPFEVSEVRYGDYNGGSKIPACPMVTVELDVDGGEQGHVTVNNRFFITKECAGLLAAFAKSIGVMEDGDKKVDIDWDQVEGMKGIVYINHREYNGQQYNQVKKFIKKVKAKKNYDMF